MKRFIFFVSLIVGTILAISKYPLCKQKVDNRISKKYTELAEKYMK